MKIKHAYSPSEGGVFHPKGKSLTRQSHKDECDVNRIVRRYYDTGNHFDLASFSEEILQLPEGLTYHEALNMKIAADEAFMGLPSEMREAHNNDPGQLLSFVESDDFVNQRVDLFGRRIEAVEPPTASPAANTPPADPAAVEPPPAA